MTAFTSSMSFAKSKFTTTLPTIHEDLVLVSVVVAVATVVSPNTESTDKTLVDPAMGISLSPETSIVAQGSTSTMALLTIQEDDEDSEDKEAQPIRAFIYTNPFGLRSSFKKAGSPSRKRTISFNEIIDVLEIEARQGPTVYSGADAAAMMLLDGDDSDSDDTDSDCDFDEEDWAPGNSSCMTAAASSSVEDVATQSTEATTTTTTTLPENLIAAPVASGNDNTTDSSDDESTDDFIVLVLIPRKTDEQCTSPYLHAASTPEEWKALAVFIRLDVYAEKALQLLQSGFPQPLRRCGTLRRCSWLPVLPGSTATPPPTTRLFNGRWHPLYSDAREPEEEGPKEKIPEIVLTTPRGVNWALQERAEDMEGAFGGNKEWAAYLAERDEAQGRLERRLERKRAQEVVAERGRAREREEEGRAKRCRERCVDLARERERRGGDSGYGSEDEVVLYSAL